MRASCELTVWELGWWSHVANEETEGFEETWQGLFWIIPVLNFHMPADSVLSCLPSVFELFEGEAASRKSRS